MVHLAQTAVAQSFGAQLASLKRTITNSWRAESPDAGFVEWAVAASDTVFDVQFPPFTESGILASRWDEAPILASVGYRLAHGLDKDTTQSWLNGMHRLMGRDAVPPDRSSFFFRPIELLGLTIGASALTAEDEDVMRWLRETLEKHEHLLPVSTFWSRALSLLARSRAGLPPHATERAAPTRQLDLALMIWLYLVDDALAQELIAADPPELHAQLVKAAAIDVPQLRGTAETAVYAIALQRSVLATVGGIDTHVPHAVDLIVNLCRRFPLFVGELTKRHSNRTIFEVKDEYDVQDLLRSVLRLHFTDVRREEWNPSYAASQSRGDLLLKPERVVIETKMTRDRLGQSELVRQLIVDKEQYRTHPDCGTLVCFVYDPEGRLRNPDAIERDLSGTNSGVATVVVVSPKGL